MLFIVPIVLIQMALRAAFPAYPDWADFMYFFVYGYVLFSRPSLIEVIHGNGWIALVIGIAGSSIMTVATFAGPGLSWVISPSYTAGSLLYQLLRSINTWAWLIVILSSGISYLNRNSKGLGYANEAVLPCYVLQQSAIIVIAFYVVQWDMGVLPKWLMIMTLSLALILAVYGLLIRWVNALRWRGFKPNSQRRAGRQGQRAREAPGSIDGRQGRPACSSAYLERGSFRGYTWSVR